MKNLYKRLKIERGAPIEKIRAAIERCSNHGVRVDAKRVLLQPASREVYDRNHELLTNIGKLRSNLGLSSSPSWDEELRKEFTKSNVVGCWAFAAIPVLMVGFLVFINSASWQFEQAQKKDRIYSYESFLRKHGDSKYASEAKSRLIYLQSEKEWAELEPEIQDHAHGLTPAISAQAKLVKNLKGFVDEFENLERAEDAEKILRDMENDFLKEVDGPGDAEYLLKLFPNPDIAESIVTRAADWGNRTRDPAKLDEILALLQTEVMNDVKQSKLIEVRSQIRARGHEMAFEAAMAEDSEKALEEFVAKYPGSIFHSRVEQRLRELLERYRDWSYVQRIDSKEGYERYLQLEPEGQYSQNAKRRLIDLEVDDILTGDVGELPDLQPLQFSTRNRIAEVEVKNDTQYTLTVRYSGPDSQKHVIPPRRTISFSIAKGKYRVAASVDASRVRPYAGSEEITYDQYGSSFYIQTTRF